MVAVRARPAVDGQSDGRTRGSMVAARAPLSTAQCLRGRRQDAWEHGCREGPAVDGPVPRRSTAGCVGAPARSTAGRMSPPGPRCRRPSASAVDGRTRGSMVAAWAPLSTAQSLCGRRQDAWEHLRGRRRDAWALARLTPPPTNDGRTTGCRSILARADGQLGEGARWARTV